MDSATELGPRPQSAPLVDRLALACLLRSRWGVKAAPDLARLRALQADHESVKTPLVRQC